MTSPRIQPRMNTRLKTPLLATLTAVLLSACAGTPAPGWQADASSALDSANIAWLEGRTRSAQQDYALARSAVARTGKIDMIARVELTQCAAQVASLILEECAGFAPLRQDASPAERAYADYLEGKPQAQDVVLLPVAHRKVAASISHGTDSSAALTAISDPFARLIAAGVLLRSHHVTPAIIQNAVDTASEQGWQRPLLAWLQLQALRAEHAGAVEEAQRIRRRMTLISTPSAAPAATSATSSAAASATVPAASEPSGK